MTLFFLYIFIAIPKCEISLPIFNIFLKSFYTFRKAIYAKILPQPMTVTITFIFAFIYFEIIFK